MGSRITMAWERCSLCGRLGPTFYCKRLGGWICAWCASFIECEEKRPARPARAGRLRRSLAPDEELINTVASLRVPKK
ncbi:hypothetical protein [Stetteria hydrogenophila]